VFTNDDPLNVTDPLGLCWPKSLCDLADKTISGLKKVADTTGNILKTDAGDVVSTSKGAGLIFSGGLLIIGADAVGTVVTVATALGAPEDGAAVPAETGFVTWVVIGGNTVGVGLIVTGLHVSNDSEPKPKPKPKPTSTKTDGKK
jgi:hypothetical protein